ncbi:xylulokinase [Paracoccidioides brasiliensis Pb18]|uniref:Uncharacterized protein n=1 Tax=Paracoccidioides brasiliensis (strain Pb18) TaxID=502780 RepID=C1GKB5_PARBD|nr:xylulokinase [Paracoccidioides brasiliensis Pb18]EEH42881.2 hypothetical protein PADG_07701 [Paracoccidioides brasiliensis Pb18]
MGFILGVDVVLVCLRITVLHEGHIQRSCLRLSSGNPATPRKPAVFKYVLLYDDEGESALGVLSRETIEIALEISWPPRTECGPYLVVQFSFFHSTAPTPPLNLLFLAKRNNKPPIPPCPPKLKNQAPLYIGFDLSTQQLNALVVTSHPRVVHIAIFDFDANSHGFPVKKWRADPRSRAGGLRPRRHGWILAVYAPSAARDRQHGSVYRNAEAERVLASLDAGEGLEGQVATALSHPFSPNWQDASTQRECDEFDEVLGGSGELTEVTRSKAHHIALKILLFGEIISLLDTILIQQYLLLVRATDSLPTAGGGHHLFLNLEWFLSLHWFSSGEISLSPCHEGSR